ncbi:site-specific DNA-methyltransferase [Salinarchaeum sp. Harcht-Bsk1]|uniref:DNA-methyltransferase n=1 Tax=Salinarchaeum sp. Harcht-Bsk1 TaxID=1333523 RepID=UPI0006775E7F|nr:site-specific DNA-methyltransferase [Salinarchaeum sp. Harcht-Bsk1]
MGDARDLPLPDDSVELVVTSPPYPMIEQWDDLFASLDPAIAEALGLEIGDGEDSFDGDDRADDLDGEAAFDAMHDILYAAWEEVQRVLVPGGIACVNVGDATRTLDRFRVYQNHARIVDAFADLGFDPLPEILWRKPANSAAKFMGSGMVPPNAYATLEHEYVLVFRNGERRSLEPGADRRYEAAYFWEERNEWFSDVWTDVRGERQALGDGPVADDTVRERSAAYPIEIPHRLVNMFSVYGDTVLDPFWGTGTTTTAAMASGRHSVGIERDPVLLRAFEDGVETVPQRSRAIAADRLAAHREFVANRRAAGDELGYDAEFYDVPVRTKQERRLRLYAVESVDRTAAGYRCRHVPAEQE